MKLYVIRHGETTGDVEDRYGGAYDDALSPHGHAQVKILAGELAGSGITAIFCSPLLRARQTAEGLAAQLNNPPITVVDDLRERAQYGPLTGLTKAEARDRYPTLVEQVKNRLNTLPGAESYADASARTAAAYAGVLAQTQAGGHTAAAIVWHGGGMRVLFRDILKMGELTHIGDCCWVELQRDSLHDQFRILDAQHIGFEFNKEAEHGRKVHL